MASLNPSFSLRPLTEADIDTCAHVAGLAFASDRQTQFKAACPTNPYNHEEGMRGALLHWLNRPPETLQATVAVDNATQTIIGWVAWGSRGFSLEETQSSRKAELQGTPELNIESVRGEAPPPPNEPVSETACAHGRLDQYTSADLATFMKSLMPPGVKCMYICSIAVHPSYQSIGVGSALVRQGTYRAGNAGVCCWVHASETGVGMFARCGFEEIRRLQLDLDDWNTEHVIPPEGEGASWGKYSLRYMLRPSRT